MASCQRTYRLGQMLRRRPPFVRFGRSGDRLGRGLSRAEDAVLQNGDDNCIPFFLLCRGRRPLSAGSGARRGRRVAAAEDFDLA